VNKRGTGSIYLRGSIYWIRYAHRGQEYRESSESESETVARKLLTHRIKETGKGSKFIGPREDRVTFEELAEGLRSDYVANGRRSLRRVDASLKRLRAHFGGQRARDIDATAVKAYQTTRRDEGAATATINRECAALKRAFKIAVDDEVLSSAPHIKMLDEDNARQGFIEHSDFIALRDALPERLRDPITFLYLSGWRVGEMKSLEWRDVDIEGAEVKLPPEKIENQRRAHAAALGRTRRSDRVRPCRAAARLQFCFSCQRQTYRRFSWCVGPSAEGGGPRKYTRSRHAPIRDP
jgi:integrase